MRIGIGIDTGGTCTDAVAYGFEGREILAFGKAPTTREDLSIGIGRVLDKLPEQYLRAAEVVALSTTLATNACVEGKGGRARLIFFGVSQDTVARVGKDYGLALDDRLIFIDSHTRPSGEVVREPDWAEFKANIPGWLGDCDAVALVEMFAHKSGARLEKQARQYIKEALDIPVVCGHSLFSESNIIKRGASALLNARLISVIEGFLRAVGRAMERRGITAPIVIVRSDGSLMSAEFTASRPVETLLCGPVASVMGAAELTGEQDCIVVDMGGTTTDIAFVKGGRPERAASGIRIGGWNTFVKGLFVDTFGLGGDSGVTLSWERKPELSRERFMPLCMAAEKYPRLLERLRAEAEDTSRLISPQQDIYVKCREPQQNGFTPLERDILCWLEEPHSLEELKKLHGQVIMPSHLKRLLSEGLVMRCGMTPTDAMHVLGDFTAYCAEASGLGARIMARRLDMCPEELCRWIYGEVKRRLYCNLARILAEDACQELRGAPLGPGLEAAIELSYRQSLGMDGAGLLGCRFSAGAKLVGIGAPIGLFLPDVAAMLAAEAAISPYSPVANALGAVVGKVSATAVAEVSYRVDEDIYVASAPGRRQEYASREEAEEAARIMAGEEAVREIEARGADVTAAETSLEESESTFEAEYGTVYLGYRAAVTATARLRLS